MISSAQVAKMKAKRLAVRKKMKKWLAVRKKAERKIDPATAEVQWLYQLDGDPYNIYPLLPEQCRQVGREFYARAPGSKIVVWFGDLPKKTEKALLKKHIAKLMWPAGPVKNKSRHSK